jgi:ABC-type transport system substrate-binding protein
MYRRATALALVAILLIAACGAPAPSRSGTSESQGSGAPRAAGPKRLTAAIQSDPGILSDWVNPPGAGVPGLDVLETLVDSGLAIPNDRGALVPLLAEGVPSLDNGLWKLMPDGRMETTWKIREGAKWHDGVPFTAADLEFTARVQMEKIVDVRNLPGFDAIESISSPDPRTITVLWKRPFVFADALWNPTPLPKHILEETYLQDRIAFGAMSYWTQDFVGTGPFKIKQYVGGSHVSKRTTPTSSGGRSSTRSRSGSSRTRAPSVRTCSPARSS